MKDFRLRKDCYEAAGSTRRSPTLRWAARKALRKIRICLEDSFSHSRRGEAGARVAMMAAVSLGIYPTMAACVKDWVHPYLQAEEYDASQSQIYDSLYPVYVEARQAYLPLWKSLNN